MYVKARGKTWSTWCSFIFLNVPGIFSLLFCPLPKAYVLDTFDLFSLWWCCINNTALMTLISCLNLHTTLIAKKREKHSQPGKQSTNVSSSCESYHFQALKNLGQSVFLAQRQLFGGGHRDASVFYSVTDKQYSVQIKANRFFLTVTVWLVDVMLWYFSWKQSRAKNHLH